LPAIVAPARSAESGITAIHVMADRISRFVCMGLFFVAAFPCRWSVATGAMPVSEQQQIYYQKEIAAFEAQDAARAPQTGIILFTGSSIFRCWTSLAQDMHPLPVLNRAFGGARTWEVLHYMDRIVLPYAPRVIVYYCGSNDVHCGSQAGDIARRFGEFVVKVHAKLPKTHIFFVSIIRAPQKRDKWAVIDAANAMIRSYCGTARGVSYLDVNPAFFDQRRQPRTDLYADDGLHLRPEAYREMTLLIKPALEKAWQEVNDQ